MGVAQVFNPATRKDSALHVCSRRFAALLAASLLLGVLPMRAEAVNSALFSPYTATATGSWPEAVAVGDVNGDGLTDVVLITSFYFDPAHDFKLFVFLQQPDGQLAPPVLYPTTGDLSSRGHSLEIGDLNGDGRQDIVLGNTNNIEVFLQQPDGTLAPSVVYSTPMARVIRIGDINKDGRADVVGLDWNSDNVAVFLQSPAGTLAPAVLYSAPHGGWTDLGLGDVNGDGLTDIVIISGMSFFPNVVVLTQAATGHFNSSVSYSVPHVAQGVAVGDVNGDGRNDIVVTYGGNQPSPKVGVYYQNAAGGLDSLVSFDSLDVPESVAIADVNQDGRADIIVVHGAWVHAGVYLQSADGSLQAEELYHIPSAGGHQPQGLAIGDFNGDRLPDIAVADPIYGLVTLMHTASADTLTTASATPATVLTGDTVTYLVSISNQGPDSARNVVVSASVPSTATVASTSPECSVSGGTWQCTLLRLDAGESATELHLEMQPQVAGSLVFSVSVVSNASDPYAANNTAAVTTSVLNRGPVANAGPDQTVRHNAKTVTLDGSASYDPDGTIASYRWQQVSGHPVTLANASSAAASFPMPKGISPVPTALLFRLTATDNAGGAASDTVVITVTR
jgi:uncharacterized repeat protein (TIGR01451 family)